MKGLNKSKKLLSEGVSLMGVGIITKILDLFKGSIFLKVFSPSEYGLIDVINQIISLSKYADIGLLNNVQREYNVDVLSNKGKAKKNKEAAFGLDLIISTLMALALIFIAFTGNKSSIIKTGIIFGALAFLSLKGFKMIKLEMIINKKFKLLSKLTLIQNLVLNTAILSTVLFYGIYSPIIVKPIILGGMFLLFYYFYPFKIIFSFGDAINQLKYGILFSGISIIYGLWVFFERFLITHYFSLKEVGLFASCLFIIKVGTSLLDELIKPFAVKVRESLLLIGTISIRRYVIYPSVLFYFGSFGLVYLSQEIIFWLELEFLQNFKGIGGTFFILSWLIPIYGIGSLSGYLLFSKGIDRFYAVYIVCFFRFLILSSLCYFFTPKNFIHLLIYFLLTEYLFFYSKQFLIYSKLFSTKKALLLIPFFAFQLILIGKNEKIQHILF
tara:strand:- start:32846 stop:34168 length:1323 start_codon:yes stop_codon:yes gene_type:complete